MKTFFLNKLKQGLFLLLAVLGTFVSYSQPKQKPKINSLPGICYMADVQENESQSFYIADTGGGNKGTSSDTGQVISPDELSDLETGGSKGTSTNTGDYAAILGRSSVNETGGKNSTGGLEQSDTGGNGGKSTTGEFTVCDTGGKGNDLGGGSIFDTVCNIYIPK